MVQKLARDMVEIWYVVGFRFVFLKKLCLWFLVMNEFVDSSSFAPFDRLLNTIRVRDKKNHAL